MTSSSSSWLGIVKVNFSSALASSVGSSLPALKYYFSVMLFHSVSHQVLVSMFG